MMAELYEDGEKEASGLPENSVFHPNNVNPVMLLTLLQIKDYLAVISANLDENATTALEDLHETGQFLCPPPFMAASSEVTDE
jgi:hypothetical protein